MVNDSQAILTWSLRKARLDTFRNALVALHCECHIHSIETNCMVQLALNKTLCLASSGGHTSFVKLLIDRGANAHAEGGGHATALELASLRRHEEIIQVLLDVNR
jgi:hypothetical protein